MFKEFVKKFSYLVKQFFSLWAKSAFIYIYIAFVHYCWGFPPKGA